MGRKPMSVNRRCARVFFLLAWLSYPALLTKWWEGGGQALKPPCLHICPFFLFGKRARLQQSRSCWKKSKEEKIKINFLACVFAGLCLHFELGCLSICLGIGLLSGLSRNYWSIVLKDSLILGVLNIFPDFRNHPNSSFIDNCMDYIESFLEICRDDD